MCVFLFVCYPSNLIFICYFTFKFKVAFVNDTNNFFINILGYQSLRLEPETRYNTYAQMDIEMQSYFADATRIKYVSSFTDDDLYAYNDLRTSFFRRYFLNILNELCVVHPLL